MKHSKFIDLSYQYLVGLFSKEDKPGGKSSEIKVYAIEGPPSSFNISQTRTDLDDLNKKRLSIIKFLEENKEVFDQLDKLITDYEQHKVLMNPTIHVARTKDTKTDIEYFKAKTFFPYPNGKRKEVKVHLGRAEKYNFNTKSEKAKEDALWKMRQTIARRIREGSL